MIQDKIEELIIQYNMAQAPKIDRFRKDVAESYDEVLDDLGGEMSEDYLEMTAEFDEYMAEQYQVALAILEGRYRKKFRLREEWFLRHVDKYLFLASEGELE